jgi:DNA polymerase elongation subunit (family B)
VKARGIDLRRRDSAPWVADAQREMLKCLARAETSDALRGQVSAALDILRGHLSDLRCGRVKLESLLVGKKLSKELDGYRVPSPGARAALQLLAAGKPTRPGQRIRLLFTRGEPGVHAWNLPDPPDPATLDFDYYEDLMLRAAADLLQPFGVAEEDLRVHMRADLGEQLRLPMHAWCRQRQPAEHAPDFFNADPAYAMANVL